MQTKTTTMYHFMSTRMAKTLKRKTIPMVGKNGDDLEASHNTNRIAKCYSNLGNMLAVPQTLNIESPYDPAVLLLGIWPRERETYVHTKIYT